jgi:hypothetical protein
MKNTIATFVTMFFLIGCTCHAGSVKAQSPDDNTIKGSYLVVIDNTMIKMDEAKQRMMDELANCKVEKLSPNIAHIIFDKDDDSGLEKVKERLSGLKWVKSVEPDRVVKISKIAR